MFREIRFLLVFVSFALKSCGVFTLPDTETEIKTNKKWPVQNWQEVFILLKDRD